MLFAGFLNFHNKPLFGGWSSDYSTCQVFDVNIRRDTNALSVLSLKLQQKKYIKIKSRSTTSAWLSAYTHWLQTHKHIRLVMNLNALCCTGQSRAHNIYHCVPEIWPWPLTLIRDLDLTFLSFGFDLWPTSLTYIANLAMIKVDLPAKDEGRRSNGSAVRAQTNGQTDGHYQVHYLPSVRCYAVDVRHLVLTWDKIEFSCHLVTSDNSNSNSRSTTSARLSTYAFWLQTHRQTP